MTPVAKKSFCAAAFLLCGSFGALSVSAQLAVAAAPAADERLDLIRQRGTLRVAVFPEYPWLVRVRGSDEHFTGPAWALALDVAARLHVRIEPVQVSLDERLSVLSRVDLDLSIAPLLVTRQRRRLADFVLYSSSAQCLFGRADNPKIAGADRLDALDRPDVTIAYITGSPQKDWLHARFPRAHVIAAAGSLADGPRDAILAGKADAGPIDSFFFARLAKNTAGLVPIPDKTACLDSREMTVPIGMAVAKGQPGFLSWLRAIAAADRKSIVAAQKRVTDLGSAAF